MVRIRFAPPNGLTINITLYTVAKKCLPTLFLLGSKWTKLRETFFISLLTPKIYICKIPKSEDYATLTCILISFRIFFYVRRSLYTTPNDRPTFKHENSQKNRKVKKRQNSHVFDWVREREFSRLLCYSSCYIVAQCARREENK